MRRALLLTAIGLAVLAPAIPAAAHQPVVLTDTDATAAEGPVIPDGTVSFAVYGDIGAGGSQGFQVRFEDGDRLFVEILLPDLEPERSSTSLPTVTIGAPDGSTIIVPTDQRELGLNNQRGRCAVLRSGCHTRLCRQARGQ